jgi:isopentenyldiphosphate isomerase
MEELIDVVDDADDVLRSAPRQLVHAKKWLHRAVHVFVFNAAGQLYLQKRSCTKSSAPNKWVSSCSGHVDAGEEYLKAAQRELGEEIGLWLSCDALQPIFKEGPCPATGGEFVWVYSCQSEGPFTLDPEEVSDGQWIDCQDLAHWLAQAPRDFAWSFVHLWEQYCARAAKDN